MKKILLRITTGLCILLVLLPLAVAAASLGFTKEGSAGQTSVYVAGIPDCFPVESFDAESGTYVGAAPAFLALVSDQTDIEFVYIRAGQQDRRATLAKNSQVDMLFACADETALLELGVEKLRLFSVNRNGVPTDVYCVFTAVSGENERAAIRSVAESLTKDDIAKLLTSDSSELVSQRRFRIVLIVLGGALIVTLIALAVFLILFFRRKRKSDVLYDNATEMGNKKYFIQMFGTAISDQARELYYVVQLAFPIDWVNGNYGADESDRILKYAADSITQRLKDNEFCARIGGGSFAAAIYSNGVDQVERRVEEILRVLNAYGEKYMNGEMKSLFHAGICALAIDDKNAEKVLYNVDQAYHRAYDSKKPYIFVNHDVLNEYRTKVSVREQAGEALDQHAFTPYVQFIVDAGDGSIRGGELLSRWENRLYGLLGPGSYISILQDMGLIVRHDLLMLEEACKLLEQWHAAGKDYFLTCNLTRVTVSDKTLVERVLAIAERYSFPNEKLILEVTEDSIEEDKESALKNINSLKEKGFRVALDDFSSGYTAVSNLYEYSVDLVKLDRQMIIDAERDSQAAALMREIIKLCHELHVKVLAEGVENESQARQSRSLLCDFVQGYFYARALPIRELKGFEEGYRPKVIPEPEPEAPVAVQPEAVTETPVGTPAEAAVETPVETPAEAAVEAPVETPAETLFEAPADVSVEIPAQPEIPVIVPISAPVAQGSEAQSADTVETSDGSPAVVPRETPAEISDDSSESAADPDVEAQPETVSEISSQTPLEAQPEAPAESVFEAPVETPADLQPEIPAEPEYETPGEAAAETPVQPEIPVILPIADPVACGSEAPAADTVETFAVSQPEIHSEILDEVPADLQPGTPAEAAVEAPVETPAELQRNIPAEPEYEAPAETVEETPAQPEIPVSVPAPVEEQVEVPQVNTGSSLEAPAEIRREAPVETGNEINTDDQPEIPAETVSEAPVETPADVQREIPAESEKEASAEPQTGNAPPAPPAPAAPESASEAEKIMLHVQYGPYRMDLPGKIDIGPVSDVLRAIQDTFD